MPVPDTTAGALSQSHRPSAIPLCVVLGLITILVVGARLWTRRVILKKFALEDWLVLAATNCFIALLVGQGLAVGQFGYNSHVWQLNTGQLVFAAKYLFLGELLLLITLWLTKMSILLFYRRIAGRSSPFFRHAVYVMMVEIMVHKVAYLIVIFSDCRPLEARWQSLDPQWAATHNRTCKGVRLNIITGSTISATEDLIFALLPTLFIWNLQLPKRQKFGLWCLFALSLVSMTAGFIRSYFIYRAWWESNDFTWEFYWVLTLSVIESCVGLVCSSVPALKPFYHHYIKPRLPTRDNTTTPSNPSPSARNSILRHIYHSWLPWTTHKPTTAATTIPTSTSPPLSTLRNNSVFNGTTVDKSGQLPSVTTEAYVTWSRECPAGGAESPSSRRRSTMDRHDSPMEMGRGSLQQRQSIMEMEEWRDRRDMFISVRSSIEVDEESTPQQREGDV